MKLVRPWEYRHPRVLVSVRLIASRDDQSKRFLLRLARRLFEVIRRCANDDLRSINAQIEYLLTEQARRAGRLSHRRIKTESVEPTEPEEEEEALEGGEPRERRLAPLPDRPGKGVDTLEAGAVT